MSWRDDVAASVEGLGHGRSGHVRVTCPACPDRFGKVDNKRSLSVNMRNGWWVCHRCDYRGRLDGHDDDDDDDDGAGDGWVDVDDEPIPEFEQPSDFQALPGVALALQRARSFLDHRRVAPEVIEAAGLGYALKGDHRGRIIIPVIADGGAWLGWVGRSVDPRVRPPYYTSPGLDRRRRFLNDQALALATSAPLIVTEGPFDALRCWPDAVAALGKPTEDHIERLVRVERPIIVALDGDAWVEGLGVARYLRLRGRPAYALALPRCEDLDSTDPELVRRAIEFAVAEKTDVDVR